MNRLILLAVPCCLLLAPSYGLAEESLANCAAIKDANTRLACFDRLAGASPGAAPVVTPVKPATGTPVTPPTPEPDVQSAAAPAQEEPATESAPITGVSSYQDLFGLENQAANKGIKKLSSRIINDFDGWDGRTVFRLENGQVWMQKDVNSSLSWRGSSHPIATIKRKSFNSYLLSVEGVNKSVRVTRVK
ncbi:MAG: hypothetical protein O6931_02670 [Gammaproteobacteria bacterium]|nr:hypothetical protein [Gammaproteobacteria bacterium]